MSTNPPVPNVVITNPRARMIARTTLDVIGVVLGAVLALDVASDAIDLAEITAPAMSVWTFLRLAFGLSVDNRNTPVGKRGVYES